MRSPAKLRPLFENSGGFAVHKLDRNGNPVVIERSGLYDAAGVVRHVPLETAIDFKIRCNEFLFSRLHPALAKYHGSTTGRVRHGGAVCALCARKHAANTPRTCPRGGWDGVDGDQGDAHH